jgi:hypothetical protein
MLEPRSKTIGHGSVAIIFIGQIKQPIYQRWIRDWRGSVLSHQGIRETTEWVDFVSNRRRTMADGFFIIGSKIGLPFMSDSYLHVLSHVVMLIINVLLGRGWIRISIWCFEYQYF